MVKKNDNDWTTYAIQPNSVASIRKYLDLCQNWLVTPPEKIDFGQSQFCNKRSDIMCTQETYIGMYETDMRNVTKFKCTICKQESDMSSDGKSIVANPFTRAQYMLLCNDCNYEITSFR